MRSICLAMALLSASLMRADILVDVRTALASGNLPMAESQLRTYRTHYGVTPEMLEALSWVSRGELAAHQADKADTDAHETEKLCVDQLRKRSLDAEPHLPAALGAAIEVQAEAMVARGARSEAVDYLRQRLKTYYATSIRIRIQKNINLLSLEGKPAPPLQVSEYLGPKPSPLSALRGKPVLLFFWAHWCGDCRAEAPLLARIKSQYAGRLLIMGPTQRYGFIGGGDEVPPELELKYIDRIRHEFYSGLLDVPVPVSQENFKNYGSSTTPTLVLIDRRGIVRLYHPGNLSYEALRADIDALVSPSHTD
ncbi:MAG TPA: TlpA disulfide reductase family protein [Bryobacteraceae bacterium]|nr:TlpA disulfide reductase family protein [Bryobacteraceae bacterium]